MNLIDFPDRNQIFRPPEGYSEEQIASAYAYVGEVKKESMDGQRIVVVAWKPTPEEIEAIVAGAPIYASFAGGLPPHFLTTSFIQAAFKG